MDRNEKAQTKRIGDAGLLVAAGAFVVISLWGPLALALGAELATALSFAPFLWIVVIAGVAVWVRSRLRMRRGPSGDGG
jgi:Flp pilus assembly protein TadB